MKNNEQKALTLLELIIVIIIVGALASLALPRVFKMVNRVKAVEAINGLGHIHRSVQRCFLMSQFDVGVTAGEMTACLPATPGDFDKLDIESPFTAAGSHFDYFFGGAISNSAKYCYYFGADYKPNPGVDQIFYVYCSDDMGMIGEPGLGLLYFNEGSSLAGNGIFLGIKLGQ